MKIDNSKKIKVNYIRWKRSDAIEKVTSMILNNLRNKINLNVVTLKMGSGNRILSIVKDLKNTITLLRFFFRDEIIHFEEPGRREPFINIIFKHKKSILTVHHLEEENQGFINWLSFFKDKQEHSSFSKLIAVSEKTKKDLVKYYGINANKIKTIYSGVDKEIFKPTSKNLGFLKDKEYILYLGSENPRKNIENLLKAFKEVSIKYPNLILVKAGYSGGGNYRENTEKLIKELDLTKKVFLIFKHIPEKELPVYYSNAELFLYPSLKEGFGMPLVEAMACGCPVVTSDLAPMNEIAKGQVLVNPYDFKDIAKGMIKTLSNKKYKEKLKKQGLERAKDFDWEKSADEIVKLYKGVTRR